ncbi:MAG: hypothetical protein ABSD70_17740 [Terracidiphilus sp.]|jgi:hypothetical protein
MNRGIYLIANAQSAGECENLIYSIRTCGCRLPIRVIPYGGKPLPVKAAWEDVKLLSLSDFPAEAAAFVDDLRRRMPNCPLGFLRRFLCWFGEFDEFLYSDNDVVALMNWEELFSFLNEYDLVHADEEYTTKGRFNMRQPHRFEELMGPGTLQLAMTAGHFLCRPKPGHKADILAGLAWMEEHPEVPIWHDQALLHITLALAKWPALNLCKPPHRWASSWAGDYKNTLDAIATIQSRRQPISHIHYSGGVGSGTNAINELLLSSLPAKRRKQRLLRGLLAEESGLRSFQSLASRAVRKAGRMARGLK